MAIQQDIHAQTTYSPTYEFSTTAGILQEDKLALISRYKLIKNYRDSEKSVMYLSYAAEIAVMAALLKYAQLILITQEEASTKVRFLNANTEYMIINEDPDHQPIKYKDGIAPLSWVTCLLLFIPNFLNFLLTCHYNFIFELY